MYVNTKFPVTVNILIISFGGGGMGEEMALTSTNEAKKAENHEKILFSYGMYFQSRDPPELVFINTFPVLRDPWISAS
jgi:hypothetical protein